jgi:hypothetical protein
MRRRKWAHKTNCNNEKQKNYNLKVYKYIRENGNWDNWDMIEVERFGAIDGNDAKKRERYWIETLKANLNSCIPTRTQKEWEIDNKEKQAEKYKEYYKDNKETIAEKAKEYRKNNKETIAEYKKEYRKNNKEILAVKDRIKYEKNKEIINEKAKEKIQCECGCEIRKQHLNRHKQSKKHIDLISMINDKI